MSTVDPQSRHVWARTPTGLRCAYMMCNARPDAMETERLDPGEARVPRVEIRMDPRPTRSVR